MQHFVRRRFFKTQYYPIFTVSQFFPFYKGVWLHFNNLITPSHKNDRYSSWLSLWFQRRSRKHETFTAFIICLYFTMQNSHFQLTLYQQLTIETCKKTWFLFYFSQDLKIKSYQINTILKKSTIRIICLTLILVSIKIDRGSCKI